MIIRFKSFLWVVFLASGLQASWGFALLGPLPGYPGLPTDFGDAWQTVVIGYGLAYTDLSSPLTPGGPVFLGDIGGPKNIGEEYRRNARTIYYAYDANFLGFFGTEGATAADGAFAIMNSLTNVTSYSRDLSEFPLNSQQFNYQAQSLFLMDVKSETLHLLVEQMGLAAPERFSWTLAERAVPPGCPLTTIYLVLQRNFDFKPTALNQLQYSSYVNNVLYSYYIVEFCTSPPATLAFTVPFAVDPLAEQDSAVAANSGNGLFIYPPSGGLQVGGFYTGLTRDDVGGLRYLLQTNNVNWETAATNSLLFTISTNFSAEQQFPNGPGTNATGTNASGFYYYDGTYGYGDLRALLEASKTNGPAVLQAMYPGLVISSVTNYFVMASNATVTAYFTSGAIGSPYGPIKLVTVTNYTLFLQERFVYKFANVFTNHYYSQSVSYLKSITVGPNYGSPYPGVPTTNTTSQTLVNTKVPSGDFFVLPMFQTNVCPLDILYTGLTNVTATTNFITSASTNVVTATNTSSYSFSQILVTYFTNYTFVINPVTCLEITNATGLYQGVDNVKFVRADFDSIIGQYFQPITNFYTMVFVTNSQPVRQYFQRVITQPDITLSANNFIAGNTFNGSVMRDINFDVGNILPGLAGPGVINSRTTFNYNKIGDAFRNGPLIYFGYTTNQFLNELTQQPTLAWASFDSSTNDPVVYPNGTSIQNLENQILVQVSPASLPNGTSGVSYPATIFTASGGSFSPPFTWSATGLPSGLTLSSGGTLSGTPTQTGTFDIIIQLNDSLTSPRTVRWHYTITIQ
jgi:hypothetical protein